jgi:hypothetical protein
MATTLQPTASETTKQLVNYRVEAWRGGDLELNPIPRPILTLTR